jgi:filamentous hemagglutinin family protein
MRRIFSFYIPTLLLCFSVQIQTVGSSLLWLFDLPHVSNAYAAGPPTTISGTPAGVGGLNTLVNSNLTTVCSANCVITGGTRPGGGANLFHSLGQFNIGAGDIATFQNGISFNSNGTALPAGLPTSNILARITGTNGNNPTLSSIYGTLQTSGFGNANLFLMNPAGFLFGPNATVNVGGMVAFTSADYLRLGDGKLFNAIPNANADAILSTAPVAAYGFLGSNPGAITVQGSQFTVTHGISLVGGNITVQSGMLDDATVQSAKLTAPGGQINLASVASPGELLAGTMNQVPNINGQSFGNLGAIQITDQSAIDVSGNGGGTVLIRGGQFLLDNSTISANVTGPGPVTNGVESIGRVIDIVISQDAVIQNGAVLETNVPGNATTDVQYGGVHVKADQIQIIGSQDFDNFPFTGIRSDVVTGSTGGNSGNITLEANSILVQDLGTFSTIVEATTGGAGNSGNIVLNGNANLHLDGAMMQTISQSASGNAGSITLNSANGDISLANFALIQSFTDSGSGNAGDVTFMAKGNITTDSSFISSDSFSSRGNAGNISLTSLQGDINLTNGSVIESQASHSVLDSTGNAGSLTLSASGGNILLVGGDEAGTATAVFTAIRTLPDGAQPLAGGGQINVSGRNLTVRQAGIQIDNLSLVEPGNITVNVSGTLTMSGTAQNFDGTLFTSNISTRARGQAPSGDVNISAHDITITDNAFSSTETFRSGNAGTLNIVTQDLQLANGGQLRSGSTIVVNPGPGLPPTNPSGAGGTIIVQGQAGLADSVLIDGSGSGIFTNTEFTGAGGSLLLNANSLTIQNGGTISAATSGTTASAIGGTITINANQVQVNSGGLITAATTGAGAGGSVNINAGSTFSSDAGTVTSTASQSTGGNLNIMAGNSVTLANGASISASSTGTGNAGNIQINAGNQLAMNGSSVKTEAIKASGGAIKITTTPGGTVELTDSTISASVLDGTGGGGSVDIDPQFVILQNSQILADAVFGPGGNINITTDLLLPDTTSVIRASSQFGQQGTIVIQSPVSPASGKLVPLGQKPLIAGALVSQRCAALAGGNTSSFTVAGRDSLPAEPGGWVSSPLALSMAESNEGPATETALSSFSEKAEVTPLLSLRKVAPAGFLTQSFGAASSDCQS